MGFHLHIITIKHDQSSSFAVLFICSADTDNSQCAYTHAHTRTHIHCVISNFNRNQYQVMKHVLTVLIASFTYS